MRKPRFRLLESLADPGSLGILRWAVSWWALYLWCSIDQDSITLSAYNIPVDKVLSLEINFYNIPSRV